MGYRMRAGGGTGRGYRTQDRGSAAQPAEGSRRSSLTRNTTRRGDDGDAWRWPSRGRPADVTGELAARCGCGAPVAVAAPEYSRRTFRIRFWRMRQDLPVGTRLPNGWVRRPAWARTQSSPLSRVPSCGGRKRGPKGAMFCGRYRRDIGLNGREKSCPPQCCATADGCSRIVGV